MEKEIQSMSDTTGVFAQMGRAANYLEKIGELEHMKSVHLGMNELAKADGEAEVLRYKLKEADYQARQQPDLIKFCSTAFWAGFANGSLTLEKGIEVHDEWIKENCGQQPVREKTESFLDVLETNLRIVQKNVPNGLLRKSLIEVYEMLIHKFTQLYAQSTKAVEPQQDWVDVKERKPEKTGWYLTYSVNGGVVTELYEFKESRFLSGEDITHWMYRPEPPTQTNK